MSFSNKVVLVTGASSGIGAATAIQFSKEGAQVVLVGRNEKKLASIAALCKEPLVLRAELTKDDNVKSIVKKTIDKFGKLDVLVNNAGFILTAPINSGDILKSYDNVMNVNLRSVVYLTSLAAPYLIESRGTIINISSIAGHVRPPMPGHSMYAVSKAAINHFTLCTAAELAPHGVRVNAVSPGPVKTDFLDNGGLTFDWESLKIRTALNRISESEEMADLIMFLASDKAKGITGSNFVADNGILIKK